MEEKNTTEKVPHKCANPDCGRLILRRHPLCSQCEENDTLYRNNRGSNIQEVNPNEED